jgi:translocator assembly and maintenance protein 41
MNRLGNVYEVLPESDMIIGYGSGVFRQASEDIKAKRLIDLLIVSEQKCDYITRLRHLGYIERWSASFGCYTNADIIFFPDIRLPNIDPVKLGVINRSTLYRRLSDWDQSFYIPGRLQKPTQILFSREDTLSEFNDSQATNLKCALAAAVISSGESREIEEYDLFKSLISLSYLGDIRVGIAENPRKIDNILSAQLSLFRKMYNPYMKSVGLEPRQDGVFLITKSPQQLWSILPKNFRRHAIQSNDFRQALIATLTNINRRESIYQAMVGLGTTGLSKSIHYLGRKISKRICFR